jgi:hypothetical protein
VAKWLEMTPVSADGEVVVTRPLWLKIQWGNRQA